MNFAKGRAVALALLVTTSLGCATVMHGPSQHIPVSTDPPGANAFVHCGSAVSESGATPATVKVSRRAVPCEVSVARGGDTASVALERRVSKAFWSNLLWSAALGLAGLLRTEKCEGFTFCLSPGQAMVGGLTLGLVVAGIGMAVDAASGAMFERAPAAIEIVLPPLEDTSGATPSSSR